MFAILYAYIPMLIILIAKKNNCVFLSVFRDGVVVVAVAFWLIFSYADPLHAQKTMIFYFCVKSNKRFASDWLAKIW